MNWILLIVLNRIYQTPFLLSAYKALKYIIHATTQTSEIYRLCNVVVVNDESEKEESVSKDIIYRIDRSIFYSKTLTEEKQLLNEDGCDMDTVVESIKQKKEFPATNHHASTILSNSLNKIYNSNLLLKRIEQQVSTKYDTKNTAHEEKLMQLWNNLQPDTPLENRISKQWIDIGFQGSDPSTDFRGMGIQGLNDLVYFITVRKNYSQSVFQHSLHPTSWYPFAIVGINITKFAYQLLESKKLQLYLFTFEGTDSYEEFYCWLFYSFDQFWIHHEPKLSVMDFESKFKEFKVQVEKDLVREEIVPLD